MENNVECVVRSGQSANQSKMQIAKIYCNNRACKKFNGSIPNLIGDQWSSGAQNLFQRCGFNGKGPGNAASFRNFENDQHLIRTFGD